MNNIKIFPFLIVNFLILASSVVYSNSSVIFSNQEFKGRYVCGQGESNLKLTLTNVSDTLQTTSNGNQVYAVTGIFSFFSGFSKGSYTVAGGYSPASKRFELVPQRWVKRPRGFSMVGMSGVVEIEKKKVVFTGKITNHPACKWFSVKAKVSSDGAQVSQASPSPSLTTNTNPGEHNPYVSGKKENQALSRAIDKNPFVRNSAQPTKKALPPQGRVDRILGLIDTSISVPNDIYSIESVAKSNNVNNIINVSGILTFNSIEGFYKNYSSLDALIKNDILRKSSRYAPYKAYFVGNYKIRFEDNYPIGSKKFTFTDSKGWVIKQEKRKNTILHKTNLLFEKNSQPKFLSFQDTLIYGLAEEDLKSVSSSIEINENKKGSSTNEENRKDYVLNKPIDIKVIKKSFDIDVKSPEGFIEVYDRLEDIAANHYYRNSRLFSGYDEINFYYDITYGSVGSGFSVFVLKGKDSFDVMARNFPKKDRLDYSFVVGQYARLDKLKNIEKQKEANKLTPKEARNLIALINKKLDVLYKKTNVSGGKKESLNELARYATSTESRGAAQRLRQFSISELSKVAHRNAKKYKKWNGAVGRPIRKLIVRLNKAYEDGFGVTTQDKAVWALRLPLNNYSGIGIEALEQSPYPYELSEISNSQYEWLKVSEKNTLADGSIPFPVSWSSSTKNSAVTYKKPMRTYARLMTPTELLFDKMGESAGRAAAGFATLVAKIAELDRNIKLARKAYFSCYPKCEISIIKNYSKAMAQKDTYFYEISGSPSLIGQSTRYGAIVAEGIAGGNSGVSLVDGGISSVCGRLFDRWSNSAGKSFQKIAGSQQKILEDTLKSYLDLLSGDIQTIQQQGKMLAYKQELALLSAGEEYAKYQVCRDNVEFDREL